MISLLVSQTLSQCIIIILGTFTCLTKKVSVSCDNYFKYENILPLKAIQKYESPNFDVINNCISNLYLL